MLQATLRGYLHMTSYSLMQSTMVPLQHSPQRNKGRRGPCPWCNEEYTTIQLPASASRKRTASLPIKVDTGVGGNVLPLCVFQHLYPNQISPADLPTGLDHVNTQLTTYNGSHKPLYGALCGPITWQPGHPGA